MKVQFVAACRAGDLPVLHRDDIRLKVISPDTMGRPLALRYFLDLRWPLGAKNTIANIEDSMEVDETLFRELEQFLQDAPEFPFRHSPREVSVALQRVNPHASSHSIKRTALVMLARAGHALQQLLFKGHHSEAAARHYYPATEWAAMHHSDAMGLFLSEAIRPRLH